MDARRHDDPHFEQVDGRRFCICQCDACYDTETNDLDGLCRCSACECVDSDHTIAATT